MFTLVRKYREQYGGQSLVEVSIFLPVILIVLLGVVEVSNLLVTQNRVSSASHAATFYASSNFVGDDWDQVGVWSSAMARVARNHVTDTLDLEANRWDIWTMKGTVNETGDGFSRWTAVHAFGNYAVMTNAEWNQTDIQGDVLAALRESGDELTKNLEIVATAAYHDRHSLLGLRAFNMGEVTRIRGLNVMRVGTQTGQAGCALFPITLNVKNISLYPQNYAGTMVTGGEMYDPSPQPGGWNYPQNPGAYNDNPRDHSGFPAAKGGHPLKNASRGDIFEARQTANPAALGAFGWLSWDGATDSGTLAASLAYPGNLSMSYPAGEGEVNYVNPHNPDDYLPSVGDWVQGSTGGMNSSDIRSLMDGYVDSRKPMQIVVFDDVEASGANYNYQIYGFAIVKLVAYKNTASEKRILVELIDWNRRCARRLAN